MGDAESKRHLISRLQELRKLLSRPVVGATNKVQAAGADSVLRELLHVDRSAEGPVSRNLVMAAASHFGMAPAPTGIIDASPVAASQVFWLAAVTGKPAFDPYTRVVGWGGDKSTDAVLNAGRTLAAVIAARRSTIFRAGACLGAKPSRLLQVMVQSVLPQASSTCRVSAPDFETTQHESASCDADDAAADAYPYGAACEPPCTAVMMTHSH